LSSLTDIGKEEGPKNSSPSYSNHWQFTFFEDNVHDHVKKCQL